MAIIIEDLSYSYFEVPVLRDVSITLEEGRIHIMLGSTGSGKTTLALIMAGLLKPQQGAVLVDGVDPSSKSFERSSVQLAFQFPEAQIFETTVEKELTYGLRNFGHSPDRAKRMSVWALDRVGLGEEMLQRDPASLSFGEQRKVALASVIAIKPRYLILDEPFAGLDWYGRQSLVDTVRGLEREGLTTVIGTHETEIVADLGDTVTVVGAGTTSKPCSVSDFLYDGPGEDQGLIPDFARTLHRLKAAGYRVPGKPRSVAGVADAISGLFAGHR
jgi:energy-coupling factor transport system ATP-binding protein